MIYRKISAYDRTMKRKRGTLLPLETTILITAVDLRGLGEEEFHGFAIAKEMAAHSEARTLTAHGTLYKALSRMEDVGLLGSRWEDPAVAADAGRPRRRLYHVTGLGRQALSTASRRHRAPRAHDRRGLALS